MDRLTLAFRRSRPDDLCCHDDELMNGSASVGIVLGHGVAVHHACHKRTKIEQIRRRAENALSAAALADEAEVMLRPGDGPCR
jgi:hypothetical protein